VTDTVCASNPTQHPNKIGIEKEKRKYRATVLLIYQEKPMTALYDVSPHPWNILLSIRHAFRDGSDAHPTWIAGISKVTDSSAFARAPIRRLAGRSGGVPGRDCGFLGSRSSFRRSLDPHEGGQTDFDENAASWPRLCGVGELASWRAEEAGIRFTRRASTKPGGRRSNGRDAVLAATRISLRSPSKKSVCKTKAES
jgi:hypothetical protein